MKFSANRSITQSFLSRILPVFFLVLAGFEIRAATAPVIPEHERFKLAWDAAARGDHTTFEQLKQNLREYVLYPYLQYEDYRHRRSRVSAMEMSAFLGKHGDRAFAAGLRRSWLATLARQGRWREVVQHSEGVNDTELRCQRARGLIILDQTDGLVSEAQALWTAGKSQPKACDPVFAWLIGQNGISPALAWERIRLAISAGQRRLTFYLARFVPPDQRAWLESWQSASANGYARLADARTWPVNATTSMLARLSIQRLARIDADRANDAFSLLNGVFRWDTDQGAVLLRDIALYAAVDLSASTRLYMTAVPPAYRDTQLLEWWARFLLSIQDWPELLTVIGHMPEDLRDDGRWSYWLAQAELRSGQVSPPSARLEELSTHANYYGFLAADELGLPYHICPQEPEIDPAEVDRIARLEGIVLALELKKVGLDDWAVAEWSRVSGQLAPRQLKNLAALAIRKGWHDRAIFALGNSGELRYYNWRFPLLWEPLVKQYAADNQLDPAWVYGTIRSESAMMETARSSANAMGLMQVLPATGRRVAREAGLPWFGSSQLRTADGNIPIGTAYMKQLSEDHGHNPVLVLGAYNAGPNVVERWLRDRPSGDTAIWVETVPYFETRDYIPRVLAFTTIYDWRMGGGPVKRISTRMPHIESGKIRVMGSAQVVCPVNEPGLDLQTGTRN